MKKKRLTCLLTFTLVALSGCSKNPSDPTSYKLSFVADSSTITERNIKDGEKIGELPTAPNKAGHDYVWKIDDNVINSESVFNYGKDKTANAVYTAKEYTIVFPDSIKKVTYGTKIGSLPEVPEITGKTNGRWTINGTVINSETIYAWTSNTSASAIYDDVVYKLTFEGTTIVKTLSYGEAIGELPNVPSKTGEGSSHYDGYWEIGGNQITSETKYEFLTNTTAKVHYFAFKPSLDDGGFIDVCSDSIRELMNAKEDESKLCEVVDKYNLSKNFDYRNKSFKLVWEEVESFEYSTFAISLNKDMSDATEYLTLNNYVVLDQLVPGNTYYYTIEGNDNNVVIKSDVYSFVVKEGIKFINVDGVENFRDISTFVTQFKGKTIKSGMVYRNGNVDNITAKGIVQATQLLGIKTELDLREEVYWKETGSYFGDDVQYKHVTNEYGGVLYIGDDPDTKHVGLRAGGQSIKEELLVFTNVDNYPVDIHCAIGRDRTGTLTMILQALLGVSTKDILCDYISSLLTPNAKIDDIDSQTAVTYYSSAFQTLNFIKSVTGEDDLSSAIVKYLTEDRGDDSTVGLTMEEVQSIRNIMLEAI